jgi:peptidoglycan hydrolase-like protein with peptidoglycan-binding domain
VHIFNLGDAALVAERTDPVGLSTETYDMTAIRNSSMILAGAAALALLGGCTPAPQISAAPTPVAAQGSPSADVPMADLDKAEIQAALNKLGYRAGAVDGFIGPMSRDAIRSYQANIGIDATGYYSPMLLERLRADAGPVTIAAQPAAVMAPKPAAAAKPAPAKKVAAAAPAAAAPAAAAPVVAARAVAAPAPAPAPVPVAAAPVPEPVVDFGTYVEEKPEGGGGGW